MCCFYFLDSSSLALLRMTGGGYVMLSISETSRFFASLRMTGALNCLKLNIFFATFKTHKEIRIKNKLYLLCKYWILQIVKNAFSFVDFM